MTSKVNNLKYGGIDHHAIVVKNTSASKQFYVNVLGMDDDDINRNSNITFPGSFVKAGHSQIHLMEVHNVDPIAGRPNAWHDRHVAVTINGLDHVIQRLKVNDWAYEKSPFNEHAIFIRDLDGNGIEFIESKHI